MVRATAIDEAVESLRRVLELVEARELDASAQLVAQLRGAVAGLEAVRRVR